MGMMDERLSPGVQDRHEPDGGAEMSGVSGDREQGVGGGAKEDAVDDGLVLEGDLGDGFWDREDDMEVRTVEQLRLSLRDPGRPRVRLAHRTVSVATAVVPDAPVLALVALLDMTAERGRATLRDGGHHPSLRSRAHRLGTRAERRAVAAKHVCHGGP
jgi:hypothetical protein